MPARYAYSKAIKLKAEKIERCLSDSGTTLQVDCDDIQAHVQGYLDTTRAARFLSVSPRTLEDWRYRGGGPLYRKIGKSVRYAVRDLITFADSSIHMNTGSLAPA